jgi:hypothetical protein
MRNLTIVHFVVRLLGIAVLPIVARAHPGHDGHELTWDFGHLAAHPLATLAWLTLFSAAIWGAVKLVRSSAASSGTVMKHSEKV